MWMWSNPSANEANAKANVSILSCNVYCIMHNVNHVHCFNLAC